MLEIDIVGFAHLMERHYVHEFSQDVLGIKYDVLKAIVYPNPPYRTFIISKRNGSPRTIQEPRKKLKALQRIILVYLQRISSDPRPCVHGFVPQRSILTNAQQHCSRRTRHVLNIDLEDFFPSITFRRVRGALRKSPFNFSHAVATLVAHICTSNGALPQGAPTSPFLSNIICRGLDRDLMDLARRCRATYTRYADDISFSFAHPTKNSLPRPICYWDHSSVALGADLTEIIGKHGFSINAKKTRLSDRSSRMEVTGLTINKFPNVRRRFVDRIRGGLHAWDAKGYAAAQHEWATRVSATANEPLDDRTWRRQTRLGRTPALKNVIWGRLLYLKMVRGKYDLLYTRLAEKYNLLCELERLSGIFEAPSLPIEPIAQDVRTALDAVFCVKWNVHTSDGVQVGGEGTAFVYRELNLLVTCDHIFTSEIEYSEGHKFRVDYLDDGLVKKDLVLIRPGTKDIFPARILHRSKQFDLALLAFDSNILPAHRYFAPIVTPIEVGAPGVLIGFPDFKKWNPPDFLNENVLNLLEPNKGQKIITITGAGSIRPGNSGGPLVDQSFKVAGVAQEGAYLGRGHDMCLAASVLDEWIENWRHKGAPEIEGKKSVTVEVRIPVIAADSHSFAATTVDVPEAKCGATLNDIILGRGIKIAAIGCVLSAIVYMLFGR